MTLSRRHLLLAAPAAALAQSSEWGAPVVDIHLHPRRDGGKAIDHVHGAGMSKAVLLTRLEALPRAKEEAAAHPGVFHYFVSADPTQPANLDALAKAIEGGAKGVGEMKHHVQAASPEMRKVYDLCAERNVPVLIHFQEVPHFANEGDWNIGYQQFDQMLKAHKKTTFIAHADFVWANISAAANRDAAYPTGPVKPGGLTDRWLADYPNFHGDLSANSGNNGLHRDPDFTRGFLARHQNKLMFGSDCACKDGRGTGGTPILERLKGKCTGRDTLSLLKQYASPEAFRKIVWSNAHALLKL
jgi:uncharacterized protein